MTSPAVPLRTAGLGCFTSFASVDPPVRRPLRSTHVWLDQPDRDSSSMLTKRIIPCLDVDRGRVVKGTNFVGLRDAGDPVEVARRYDEQGADELVFLDISASHEGRAILLDMVRQVAEQIFMPFTVGGGIRTLDDATQLIQAGAEKVSLNSAAVRTPGTDRGGVAEVRQLRDGGEHRPASASQPRRVDESLGSSHQRRPRADRAGSGGVGEARGGTRGRRDRPHVDGRRRHQERLRPADAGSRDAGR